MRKYYGECGQVTHHQIILTENLITELLKAIHGQMGKHPGITKKFPRMQIKILLPGISKKNQTMGNAMRRLYQVQKNQQ